MKQLRFVLLLLGCCLVHGLALGQAQEIPYEGTRPAPEFPAEMDWLNTEHPLTLAQLKGKVVVLDFWTYCCINCMHIIPDLKKLEAKYTNELVVIGVHSAKFDNEKDTANIRKAILRYEIEHPVINDKDFAVWRAYGVRAWPTLVLINPNGRVIGFTSGEGIYEPLDRIIGEAVRLFDQKKEIDRTPLALKLERQRSAQSELAFPGKIIVHPAKRQLLFTDSNHNRLLITSLDGEIQETIGQGQAGLQDGDFASARFFRPQGLALDANRELLYVADTENHAIRAIDLAKRTVKTLAGTGQQARGRNQEGRSVELNSPWDLILIGDLLYVAMAGPHQLWTVHTESGEAKVYAGSGRENITDGPLLNAALAQPSGIATDGEVLYFVDSEVSAVRRAELKSDGKVETLIGVGLFEFGDVDGTYPEARLQHPIGLAWHAGEIFVADTYNHKIKKLDPKTRTLSSYIGTGQRGNADGVFNRTTLNEPNGLCFFEQHCYIADSNNHAIRAVDLATKEVTTLKIRGK